MSRAIDIHMLFGQMLCVGFEGTDLDRHPRLRQLIQNGLVGSVILYSRNVEGDLRKLMQQLRQIPTEYPLWIMIDQEGGKVQRIRDEEFPSHREMRETRTPQEAYSVYRNMAAMLGKYGFTVNLAPVIDLDINPYNPIIGYYGRSFSDDPDVVCRYAKAFIDAHREEGVLTCIKHYPGHGSATKDTHLHWVDVTDHWQEAERDIFKRMIDDGYTDMLMSSHVFNRDIDDVMLASLSSRHLREIVRDRWNYDGVIVSDDLLMKAISEHYDIPRIVMHAINAGNSMLLFSDIDHFAGDYAGNLHRVVEKLLDSSEISMTDLEESFKRVTDAKRTLVK